MTVQERKDKWLAWIKSQVGYHEIGNNITKYAEDNFDERAYGFSMTGQPWCDFFFDYGFWINFGFETGNAMLYQTGKYGGAAVMNSASFYRSVGAFYRTPEVGDQAIYLGEQHTGAVVAVYSDGTFDCIDGNYSDAVTFRPRLTQATVIGFGRPNWSYGLDKSVEEKQAVDICINDEEVEVFNRGDIVRVKHGAVSFDNGAKLASIVFEKEWKVFSQWNRRVVINESIDGTRQIMTPVDASYLEHIETKMVQELVSETSIEIPIDKTIPTSMSEPKIIIMANTSPIQMIVNHLVLELF